MTIPKEKKIKAAVPYECFLLLKNNSKQQNILLSELVRRIVKDTIETGVIFRDDQLAYAVSIRSNSPNNIHFFADFSLEKMFSDWKKLNRIKNDSVAVRLIILEYKRIVKRFSCKAENRPTQLFDGLEG